MNTLGRGCAVVSLGFVLTACGKPEATPARVADGFYGARMDAKLIGAPDARQLEALTPYLGEELRTLLALARQRHDEEAAKAPGEKPAFADGDLFSSLFEGPTSFKVGIDEPTGDVHRVSVQLAYDRQQPVVSWTDKVVVKPEKGRYVVADIEYGGTWEFGNKGSLVSMLKKALTPQVAANVLGKWTVAGHRIPGISAMNDNQARALLDQAVEYTAETATSGKDVCPHATYRARSETAGAYLATSFKVDPQKLGLQPDTKLDITEISCGGVAWGTVGGVLFLSPAGRAFAPWNGVFFELQRASAR